MKSQWRPWDINQFFDNICGFVDAGRLIQLLQTVQLNLPPLSLCL